MQVPQGTVKKRTPLRPFLYIRASRNLLINRLMFFSLMLVHFLIVLVHVVDVREVEAWLSSTVC